MKGEKKMNAQNYTFRPIQFSLAVYGFSYSIFRWGWHFFAIYLLVFFCIKIWILFIFETEWIECVCVCVPNIYSDYNQIVFENQ